MTSSAHIRSRLKNAADRVDDYQGSMRSMKTALSESVSAYRSTESAIMGNTDISENNNLWNSIKPWIGAAGVVGDIAVLVGDVRTGDFKTGAAWAGIAKDLWGPGWDIGAAVKNYNGNNASAVWKEILKLNPDDILASVGSDLNCVQKMGYGFKEGIKGSLGELRTPGGAAKQAGGILLSGVVNAFGNYDEYKSGEISASRAMAETVMETAVDWGKGLLIGAAVTAGFAAIGFAAPGALVVGATVAISAGVDWLCEKFTGKNVTEWVSDTVLDVAGKAWEGISSGVEVVKREADALWKDVASGWNAFTGSLGAVFA